MINEDHVDNHFDADITHFTSHLPRVIIPKDAIETKIKFTKNMLYGTRDKGYNFYG